MYDFVTPFDAYLSQVYTGDADLETYFSVCDDVRFVDDEYLESNSEPADWLRFLKGIGAKDVPRVTTKKLYASYEECEKRGLDRKYYLAAGKNNINYHSIEDHTYDSLSKVLNTISRHDKAELSLALWHLLVKAVPSEQRKQYTFFQGVYRWFYYKKKREVFDSAFYRQLKETPWLPDEQGKFRSPSECFAPTSENRRVLGDSVSYLSSDFNISEENEPARWLAEKLGIHLNADKESVLNYLQTLSGTIVSIEDIKPLYRFLDRQEARPRERFEKESLIFTPDPEPRWWRANQVFWEDESAVFGTHRGYLKAHYPERLKQFFSALGVSERASPLHYVRGIREITSTEQAGDVEVRKRVKILYGRLWGVLQEKGSSLEEWNQTHTGRYWLGKKGSEWGVFYFDELVWNDHPHLASLFEGKIPFWEFNDLSDLATKYLGIEGCSQAKVKFYPSGEREKDKGWSDKVRDLRPYIHAFLKSPSLCDRKYEEIKSDQVLDQLSVRLAEKLETTYKLKEISVPDPEPRPSYLDVTDQETTLWLGSEADEDDEYTELIGDALADYFGIKELSQFVEHLLSKDREKVLFSWKRKGLRIDVSLPEEASKEDALKPIETFDENTISGADESVGVDFEREPPPSQSEEVIDTRGGHWGGTSNGGKGGGGHGGRGGGGEGQLHQNFKEYLADNPSQLGEGLTLVKMEYRFVSRDEADILLKDSLGNPVTVEVETHIPSGNYVGVWQAVKYKHLAAVKYQLPCEEVRSILAAPEIPDDVKAKCVELGIEAREVPMPL